MDQLNKNQAENSDFEVKSQQDITSPSRKGSYPIWYILIAPLASLLLGMLLLYFTKTPWQFVSGSTGSTVLYGALLGMVTLAMAVLVTRLPFAGTLRKTCQQLLPIFGNVSISQMIILALAAGLGEEILFRGFLQTWFMEYLSVELSIAIAAICFGLLHFASLSYFLLTTLLGAAMGVAYHLSGSLLLVITWHSCYDYLAFWVFSNKPSLLGIGASMHN